MNEENIKELFTGFITEMMRETYHPEYIGKMCAILIKSVESNDNAMYGYVETERERKYMMEECSNHFIDVLKQWEELKRRERT